MDAKTIKVLELAIHPSTGEHERNAALALFSRAIEKAGGLSKALGHQNGDPDLYWFRKYRELEAERIDPAKIIARLTMERDDFASRYFRLAGRLRDLTSDPSDLHNPSFALYGALDNHWRTLADIRDRARRNGFTGAENTLRKRADNLADAGKIEVREEGWTHGGTVFEARAWRLSEDAR